jgi:tRNA modification GTPase
MFASAASTADTIAALATPTGTSALALIRVSGPACRELAITIFSAPSPTPPLPLSERRPTHAPYRAIDGRQLDDLVWTFFPGPRTATGEDTLELTPHGNPLIVHLILTDLFARGCRPAEPGEFTRRAFLAGCIDLTQAEAVMDLIHARSERALVAAQRQLHGALGRHLESLIGQLLATLARIEAYIDFPDEDLPPEDRRQVIDGTADVLRGTSRLLATHRYGDLLREGLKTVLLGAPNAGKSSLLNALLGRDRALVSPEPGTTRDFIEEPLQVGPHLLRLIDTAGLNPAPGDIECLGIAKTHERLTEADLVLWIADATQPLPALPPEAKALLRPDNTILVLNKVDLLPDPPLLASLLPQIYVSALQGSGLDELRTAIVRHADSLAPALAADEQLTVNARHADALRRAEAGLRTALDGLRATPPHPIELISADLRAALDALGEIAGRIDNERMLDALFSTFCIGK